MLSYTQGQIFILFFLLGIVIGSIYDIFRVIRKNFKTSDFVTQIEDIIFLIISGILILCFILKFCIGEIRFYVFIAIFLGILLYFLTISKAYVIILNIVVKFCKKILSFFVNLIKIPYIFIKKHIKKL